YGVNARLRFPEPALRDDDETVGVVGLALARVLGLCAPLHIADCPAPPTKASPGGAGISPELASLAAADRGLAASARPRLDLLAATAGGAPNVVSLFVGRAERQDVRELDENYVAMHI